MKRKSHNHSSAPGSPPPPAGGRWNHLYALWESALALDSLPQFDRWVAANMKHRHQFGRRDRAWYSERLFGAIRHGVWALLVELAARGGAQIDWRTAMEQFTAEYPDYDSVRDGWRLMGARALFAILEWRREDGEKPLESPPSPAMLTAAIRLATASAAADAPIALRCAAAGVPPWWSGALARRAEVSQWDGDLLRQFFARQESRPPLWLRVNRPADFDKVKAELLDAGFAIAAEDAPAIAAAGPRGIFELECYKRGLVAIQDWASQQIGRRVPARPGAMIWDCCAGGGGKALQIAAALDNRGAIHASDIREHALDETRRRVREAGYHNLRALAWDGRALPEFGREIDKRGGFDAVLVDAPCSSSGVWRRNPDAMLRVMPTAAPRLAETQSGILAAAAEAVRPGGALIYATCSWMVEEDEEVVEKFLGQRGGDFALDSMTLIGSPAADSDTMFATVMTRR